MDQYLKEDMKKKDGEVQKMAETEAGLCKYWEKVIKQIEHREKAI